MRPPEEEIRLLVGEWLKKADLDFQRMFTLIEQALPGAKWLLAQGFSVATAATGA